MKILKRELSLFKSGAHACYHDLNVSHYHAAAISTCFSSHVWFHLIEVDKILSYSHISVIPFQCESLHLSARVIELNIVSFVHEALSLSHLFEGKREIQVRVSMGRFDVQLGNGYCSEH